MSVPNFKVSAEKMHERITAATREQRLNAIQTFLNIAEPRKYTDWTPEEKAKLETCSDVEIEETCREVCLEAINRDFVSFALKGQVGNVGKTVYNSLLKEN